MKFVTIQIQVDPSSIDMPNLSFFQVRKIQKMVSELVKNLEQISFVRYDVYNDSGGALPKDV